MCSDSYRNAVPFKFYYQSHGLLVIFRSSRPWSHHLCFRNADLTIFFPSKIKHLPLFIHYPLLFIHLCRLHDGSDLVGHKHLFKKSMMINIDHSSLETNEQSILFYYQSHDPFSKRIIGLVTLEIRSSLNLNCHLLFIQRNLC